MVGIPKIGQNGNWPASNKMFGRKIGKLIFIIHGLWRKFLILKFQPNQLKNMVGDLQEMILWTKVGSFLGEKYILIRLYWLGLIRAY